MSNQDFLIIANGSKINPKIIEKIAANRVVIILDGAANSYKSLRVTPDIILGDLDSINNQAKEYFTGKKVKFIHTPDQNYTDLEKAIIYINDSSGGARSIYITNALGKRCDHMLGNISFLKKYHHVNIELKIFTSKEIIEFIAGGVISLNDKKNANIAIIGMNECIATSTGLKYELNDYKISLGKSESICNKVISNSSNISIKGDALVIYNHSLL
jgi:thiamine pyrophosphokinase